MTDKELTLQLLQSKPISYRADFARICESVTAGIMLSQAYYWHGRSTKHGDGWFEKTGAEWEAETALTEKQQQTARHILSSLGLMESERKGDRGRMCSRINFENLHKMLVDYYTTEEEKEEIQIGKKEILHRQNGESKNGKKGNLSLQRIHTENTTENAAALIAPNFGRESKTKIKHTARDFTPIEPVLNILRNDFPQIEKAISLNTQRMIEREIEENGEQFVCDAMRGRAYTIKGTKYGLALTRFFDPDNAEWRANMATVGERLRNAAESLKMASEGISEEDQAAFDNLHRLMAEAN